MDGELSDSTQLINPELETFIYMKRLTCYMITASMGIIVYDSLITFGQEVELIWRSGFSIPKVVYFIHRYSSLIFAILYIIAAISGTRTVASQHMGNTMHLVCFCRCMAVYQVSTWFVISLQVGRVHC
ncbi:hypothetical protein C8Q75DRAFT_556143 [Abortiporus biennis]|nr:hypothetical protein C8Q75DRAFT_556143 [Abortiporus biennis]